MPIDYNKMREAKRRKLAKLKDASIKRGTHEWVGGFVYGGSPKGSTMVRTNPRCKHCGIEMIVFNLNPNICPKAIIEKEEKEVEYDRLPGPGKFYDGDE